MMAKVSCVARLEFEVDTKSEMKAVGPLKVRNSGLGPDPDHSAQTGTENGPELGPTSGLS